MSRTRDLLITKRLLYKHVSKASFRMLTLYQMDRMTEERADAFLDRLEQAFRRF